jgi:hypothetical protein
MADGFRRMPVEAEVAAGNREVGGHGQFLAGTRTEQSAVVADAEAQVAGGLASASADLAKQGKFAALAIAWQEVGPPEGHDLRIGQIAGQTLPRACPITEKNLNPVL